MCGLSGEFLWRILLLNIVYFENHFVTCEEPLNTVFNANIRDYSVKEDDINSTNVRTLQKEEVGRYASFAPIRNPIRFKEIPDNALSSSSYGRLLHHGHAGHEGHEGYGIHDGFYEDGSHYGHGYEYIHGDDHPDFGHHGHDSDHHGHDSDHHGHGHGHHFGHHHHLGYKHHHKFHDHHHLASKALLWPVAGLALLGAAAAFVTNPVLLQLGVISGRRRRRDTVEVSGPDYDSSEDWPLDPYGGQNVEIKKETIKTGISEASKVDFKLERKKVLQMPGSGLKSEKGVKKRYIPVPLKLRGN